MKKKQLLRKKKRTRKHLIVFLAYEYHGPPDAQKWLVHWGRSASSSPRKEVVRDPALSVCWRPPGQSSGPDCRRKDCSELPTRFLLKKWNESMQMKNKILYAHGILFLNVLDFFLEGYYLNYFVQKIHFRFIKNRLKN